MKPTLKEAVTYLNKCLGLLKIKERISLDMDPGKGLNLSGTALCSYNGILLKEERYDEIVKTNDADHVVREYFTEKWIEEDNRKKQIIKETAELQAQCIRILEETRRKFAATLGMQLAKKDRAKIEEMLTKDEALLIKILETTQPQTDPKTIDLEFQPKIAKQTSKLLATLNKQTVETNATFEKLVAAQPQKPNIVPSHYPSSMGAASSSSSLAAQQARAPQGFSVAQLKNTIAPPVYMGDDVEMSTPSHSPKQPSSPELAISNSPPRAAASAPYYQQPSAPPFAAAAAYYQDSMQPQVLFTAPRNVVPTAFTDAQKLASLQAACDLINSLPTVRSKGMFLTLQKIQSIT